MYKVSLPSLLLFLSILTVCASRCEVYVHLPYSATGAKVVTVARWSPDNGLTLSRGSQLFQEKYEK